jgi:hypothetical protein
MRRRLAILGFCGAVAIVIASAGWKIHSLEQRLASLESAARARALVPATPVTFDWVPDQSGSPIVQLPGGNPVATTQLPNRGQLPKGATPHEINGMTYWVVPLATNDAATIRR